MQASASWNDLHVCFLCLCATVPGDGALGWCIPKRASILRLQAYIRTSLCCHKVCMLLHSYSSLAGWIACWRAKSAHWSFEASLFNMKGHDLQNSIAWQLTHGVHSGDVSPVACNCELWPMQGGLVVLAEARCSLCMMILLLGADRVSKNGYTYLADPLQPCFTADLFWCIIAL